MALQKGRYKCPDFVGNFFDHVKKKIKKMGVTLYDIFLEERT